MKTSLIHFWTENLNLLLFFHCRVWLDFILSSSRGSAPSTWTSSAAHRRFVQGFDDTETRSITSLCTWDIILCSSQLKHNVWINTATRLLQSWPGVNPSCSFLNALMDSCNLCPQICKLCAHISIPLLREDGSVSTSAVQQPCCYSHRWGFSHFLVWA